MFLNFQLDKQNIDKLRQANNQDSSSLGNSGPSMLYINVVKLSALKYL